MYLVNFRRAISPREVKMLRKGGGRIRDHLFLEKLDVHIAIYCFLCSYRIVTKN